MNAHTPSLSLRELQVLRLAAEGLTAKETAKLLHLSESAVNLYLCHARHKLGAKTKAEAIAMMMESRWLFRESIAKVKSAPCHHVLQSSDHVEEMLLISNRMHHLLEDMLLADVARKVDSGDLAVWDALVEKFLKVAAQSCGYQIVKEHEPESGIVADKSPRREHELLLK